MAWEDWDDYDPRDYDEQRNYENDVLLIWKCNKCGHRYEDRPGWNEAQPCHCGGTHEYHGESYPVY